MIMLKNPYHLAIKKRSRMLRDTVETIQHLSEKREIAEDLPDNANNEDSASIDVGESTEIESRIPIKKIRKEVNLHEVKKLGNRKVKKQSVNIGTSEIVQALENSEDTTCSKFLKVDNADKSENCSSSQQITAAKGSSMLGKKTFPFAGTTFIPPASKKIGFIGLGEMGLIIVKHLLTSRYKVTIWNKTKEKCKECVDAGATIAANPAEVVKSSDIIFGCVADTSAVNAIVFGTDGVLKGFEDCSVEANAFKGYVELSSVYFQTNGIVAAAITRKGGKYLEAPIFGTKQFAKDRSLIVIASGDRDLFHVCQPYFYTFAIRSYCVGPSVGDGSKYSIILNMYHSASLAALIGALTIAKEYELDLNKLFDLLREIGYVSKILEEKFKAVVKNDFANISSSLKRLKKAMTHGLHLSEVYVVPIGVKSTANIFLKSTKI
ncbi:oxidoreductase GLYR1 [Trichonephila clavata]|uniref:Oxidoreductase GLYR1 n=1 Tax=Trichonephila clavata TaxID=2740835 RepID=A0A8X6GPI6_TRICU|nr:oxidoreductase GLYR1 [Trichonephila clavata]